MKIMIFAEVHDIHVQFVRTALERVGHDVRLYYSADFPSRQKNSLKISDEIDHWKMVDDRELLEENNYDIIWWQGRRKPFIPMHSVHHHDYQFSLQENNLFFYSLTANISPKAWWVNPIEGAHRVSSLVLKLKTAKLCGFKIPTTLCSNDPREIRQFVLLYDQEVVYKPFADVSWVEENGIKIAEPTKINFMDLPSNKSLQLAPGIFQKEVKKKAEIRVFAYGDYLLAAGISNVTEMINWQKKLSAELSIHLHILPLQVEKALKEFMQKMGVVYGAFTLLIDENDEYIFIDFDEQSPFLWVEEANEDFMMLDVFVQFLLAKSKRFRWKSQNFEHCIARYRRQIEDNLLGDFSSHIDTRKNYSYQPMVSG